MRVPLDTACMTEHCRGLLISYCQNIEQLFLFTAVFGNSTLDANTRPNPRATPCSGKRNSLQTLTVIGNLLRG
jgi:hypothetical protein